MTVESERYKYNSTDAETSAQTELGAGVSGQAVARLFSTINVGDADAIADPPVEVIERELESCDPLVVEAIGRDVLAMVGVGLLTRDLLHRDSTDAERGERWRKAIELYHLAVMRRDR